MSAVPPGCTLPEQQAAAQPASPSAASNTHHAETEATAIQLTAPPPPAVDPNQERNLPPAQPAAAVVDADGRELQPGPVPSIPAPPPDFGGRLCAVSGCAAVGTKLCGDLTWFDCATCDRVYCAAHSASGWKESPVGYRCANVALCTNHKSSQCAIL